jgi:hypothetical protein
MLTYIARRIQNQNTQKLGVFRTARRPYNIPVQLLHTKDCLCPMISLLTRPASPTHRGNTCFCALLSGRAATSSLFGFFSVHASDFSSESHLLYSWSTTLFIHSTKPALNSSNFSLITQCPASISSSSNLGKNFPTSGRHSSLT